jgi:hypothetical protein
MRWLPAPDEKSRACLPFMMPITTLSLHLVIIGELLLGWTTMHGLQCYVRQFRNIKGRVPLDAIDAAALADGSDKALCEFARR